jgi:hypothetical protein
VPFREAPLLAPVGVSSRSTGSHVRETTFLTRGLQHTRERGEREHNTHGQNVGDTPNELEREQARQQERWKKSARNHQQTGLERAKAQLEMHKELETPRCREEVVLSNNGLPRCTPQG